MEHLSHKYWNNRYANADIGWDLGEISPPLKSYFDILKIKNKKILIPGCGNAYEAEYLISKGFTDITLIDFAEIAVENMRLRFKNVEGIRIINQDFFDHNDVYDVIVEQTFFCALHLSLRTKYVQKMHELLNKNGYLVGLLFDKTFEKNPPYGGNKEEYKELFEKHFTLKHFENCYNSISPRANSEIFIKFIKK